ncbi:MAG: M56 family metallopeptidase [Erythrobacter sp.]|uniref:M56 family metallopeptidase n=1 Tax=Erythrobacter sp. TaxID=1042 RepID=UPI00261AB627|nr:M56 family metallopeptidase [Erythrobacter sp.]MDJ0977902.1 M56 family metallopeptidase [Erythrobacter sp.]
MSAFLFDTLIWTGALIALVLVLRRPVTRWFGAPAAYALWALPMLRLILPPIELPAWLAPEKTAPEAVEATGHTAPLVVEIASEAASVAPDAAATSEGATSLIAALSSLPLTEIALTAWLGGAAVFLFLRFSAYFRLRNGLMREARAVGSAKGPLGTIRLIETPGTTGPLAFGVLEPVIALPPGFMAQVDRNARDLALAHELQHHRGYDLLINVLAQPLFALHWFNPLGRYGWLALRRDQEAACDARVIASAPKETRAAYADVIASFAAGPNVALAAPMACPVLGDKSIIQRLRNLKMTEQSSNTKSRKMASRLMLGTAIVALPLTASVSYAERIAPEPPAPPSVTAVAPKAPAAPVLSVVAIQEAPEAPEAPEPPEPPEAPEVTEEEEVTVIVMDPDEDGKARFKLKSKDGQAFIWKDEDGTAKELRKRARSYRVKIVNKGEEMDEEELEVLLEEMREGLNEADEAMEEMRVELKALEESKEWAAMLNEQNRTFVRMHCDDDSEDVATTKELKGGGTEVLICQSRVMARALEGLEQARAAIAENREMQAKMREEVLRELDQQIESWKKKAR